MSMCGSVGLCMHVFEGGQRRVLDSLGVESQVVVSCAGTKFRLPARAARALKHSAFSSSSLSGFLVLFLFFPKISV